MTPSASTLHPDEILITGATGLVGAVVVADLLECTDASLTVLVRADDDDHALARAEAAVEPWLGERGRHALGRRLRAVAADLEHDDLALSPAARARLAMQTTHIIHSAASVRFDHPLDVARSVNVEGARRVLDLARDVMRHGGLRRVTMVSTAFVGGTSEWFREDERDCGQSFRNTYERSKLEAEKVAAIAAADLPITVVRPSVVIGHSLTGKTTAFNVLYAPLRIFLGHTGGRTVPVKRDLRIDTVPVDWVARVIREALFNGSDGITYAAASGREALSAGDIAMAVAEACEVAEPELLPARCSPSVQDELVAGWGRELGQRTSQALAVFAPYLTQGSTFDTARADGLMRAAGLSVPNPLLVLGQSLRYAWATDFGRSGDARRRRAATAAVRGGRVAIA